MNFGQFQQPLRLYTRLQNHTNMVIDKHEIQTLKVVVCCIVAFDVVV